MSTILEELAGVGIFALVGLVILGFVVLSKLIKRIK